MARMPVPVVGECRDCHSWGLLARRWICHPCIAWARSHPRGTCAGCGVEGLGLKRGYCRLCWLQASRDAGRYNTRRLLARGERLGWHQLEFTTMRFALRRRDGSRAPWRPRPEPPAARGVVGQLLLLQVPIQHAPAAAHLLPPGAPPAVMDALCLTEGFGAAHGWSSQTTTKVKVSLAVLLSHRQAGHPVLRSEVETLRSTAGSVVRTCAVLTELGLLVDDRADPVEELISARTAGLPEPFTAGVAGWLRVLARGNARRPQRSGKTVAEYSRWTRPVLLAWAVKVDSLREVTTAMIEAALASPPPGVRPANLFTALRSMFGHLHRTRMVFTDPTRGIHLGAQVLAPILPLTGKDYARVVASASDPAGRLVVALAGVHGARPGQIRALTLTDADLWQRRLVVAGNPRRMDDLTRQVLLDWLVHRHATWPRTANPHLLLTKFSARSLAPVSATWLRGLTAGSGVPLDRLRMDRQLEEALTHGPDPLHLQRLFAISDASAMRYARAARFRLEAEHRPTPV